ncbi:SLC13 family permease [Ureibacillus manganicus]|uniref:Tricarboxylate transporter n=1 Tax=Ureibacillus manganicus DSM 26584 TaxID=1384049 RepID=A0A0A3I6A9_9BACL|nr:SLC13 family permease [Ureibacillus manganicus]KGR78233.1 tricarboxylate transporter [Ureibacillus manganicus DSM 26584]
MELTITFTILAVTIILFVTNRVRGDLVAIGALLAFIIFGILTPQEALAGFSNSVVIMIAGLFVVGAGLLRTGLAGMAATLLLKWSGDNELKLFVLLLVIVASVGAFMSNTGTVALMLPVVVSIAMSIKVSPSKFLMPLSYIASMSGLMTLIASPPNLIVSQTLVDNGFEKLGFFSITPIGIVASIVAIVYLVIIRNTLLPNENSRVNTDAGYKLSPKKIVQDYHLENRLFLIHVPDGSPIVEIPLAKLKLPAKYQIYVMKIHRNQAEALKLLPMNFQELAGPNSLIHPNDELYVQGTEEDIERFVADFQLEIKQSDTEEGKDLVSKEIGVAEVLLTPQSSLIGETIREIGFREKYNLNILGINSKGEYLLEKMTSKKLRFGDALLVQGTWDEIELLSRETKDVVVVGQPKEHAGLAAATGKAPIAGLILLLMVGLMVFEVFDAVTSVMIGAVLMIITGCLRNMDDAYGKMNFESIVLVAGMLPMATALQKTGGMTILSDSIIQLLGGYGPYGVLIGVYLLTVVFGQFVSNTATAVLFAPIAMNAALLMDASPYTFMIAVAAASGMAFATPIASPTNSLVLTAGGYKFMDFVRVGVPLQVIMFVVMMLVIPFIYPF